MVPPTAKWNINMLEAPKDRPILAWCSHEAGMTDNETFMKETSGVLNLYVAHGDGLSYAKDGPNILVWGGGDFYEDYYPMSDWWFVADSEFERAAYPVAWQEIEEFVK